MERAWEVPGKTRKEINVGMIALAKKIRLSANSIISLEIKDLMVLISIMNTIRKQRHNRTFSRRSQLAFVLVFPMEVLFLIRPETET